VNRPHDVDRPSIKQPLPVIEDPDELPSLTLVPIGVVRSPLRNHFDAPRQPGVGAAVDGEILLRRGLQNAVRDLAGFERLWVLFQFNYSRGWKDTVVPPRDGEPRGTFATRAPHRPNPVGLSCVRLLHVQGRRLLIRDHDLLHGTPVLDLKPYLPYCDAHPVARGGWVDELLEPGPDHRWR